MLFNRYQRPDESRHSIKNFGLRVRSPLYIVVSERHLVPMPVRRRVADRGCCCALEPPFRIHKASPSRGKVDLKPSPVSFTIPTRPSQASTQKRVAALTIVLVHLSIIACPGNDFVLVVHNIVTYAGPRGNMKEDKRRGKRACAKGAGGSKGAVLHLLGGHNELSISMEDILNKPAAG